MTSRIRLFAGALLSIFFTILLSASAAQTPAPSSASASQASATPPPSTSTAATSTANSTPSKPAAPVPSGSDRPPILVSADTDEISTTITLHDLDAKPGDGDLELGMLTSSSQPSLLVRPKLAFIDSNPVKDKEKKDKPGQFVTTFTVSGLAAFGDTTAPLLYKGKQVEILRFSKPGLTPKPPVGDTFVVREQGPQWAWLTWLTEQFSGSKEPAILVVLANPSTFSYTFVRARLRFDNQDVCLFTAEKFPLQSHKLSPADASCNTSESWNEFDIPQYAQVSLRADPYWTWFIDPATGYARSATRKGWLTLRFQTAKSSQIQEQNIPIEVQFEPSGWTLFCSLFWVALFLSFGAALSLFLRVTVPNMKRKNQLKDQLNDAGRTISTISSEVDSNLRVLLRVERRTLDELRMAVWPFGPGYADYATRVEQGLPPLNRRIGAVVELDAALIRKKALSDQNVAPTKLEQIEEMLSAASETLKQDLLSDEDWVFVNQRLENAQKLLREPTQTEKEAFEAMLANRWKAIKTHFDPNGTGSLIVPDSLAGMAACFPDASLLPGRNDADFPAWVDSIGVVRADLQLSALNLVWEFQFLLPSVRVTSPPTSLDPRWQNAIEKLNTLLSTPAVDNLREARRLLRELAERVTEDELKTALTSGAASVVMDPSMARPDRRMRFSVEFREPRLNRVAARQLITCHWTFDDSFLPKIQWYKNPVKFAVRIYKNILKFIAKIRKVTPEDFSEHLKLPESGWFVHHYFEKSAVRSVVSVTFHDSNGQPIVLSTGTDAWARYEVELRPDTRGNENLQRFWLEVTQVGAALLVPLATLASNTVSGGTASHWWEVVALGFGSDTIKNIIVGKDSTPTK